HLHEKWDSDPVGHNALLLSENIMRRQPPDYLASAAVFFPHFAQRVFLEARTQFKLPRARIPAALLVAAIGAALVEHEIPLAVVAIKRRRDPHEIYSDSHVPPGGIEPP